MLVLSTLYGNGYKTQDEPTIKFLEKMEQLRNTSHNLSYLTDIGDRECIKQVIDITKPEVVIPIHTEVPEAIKELTDKAVILKDMEIYQVKEQINEPRENKSGKNTTKQTTNTRRNNSNT